ncbi:unnamed protein product, partial [Aphanomyces euteiches]
LLPNESVEEYLFFAFADFTPKRDHNDYGDRLTPRTIAQWTNRHANYAERRWKTLSGPMRSGGFQRLAACVLNAAAMTRKLPTLEVMFDALLDLIPKQAPYRQPPSTAIEKDGTEAGTLAYCSGAVSTASVGGSKRRFWKRGLSSAPVVLAPKSTSRPRSMSRPSSTQDGSIVLAHVRLVTRVEDLEGQNRELQAQNQELRNRLGALEKNFANYSRADLLRALRREYETTAAQLEEMKHRVDSLWGLRKEQKSAIR